ncbi:MAG TPA: SgcJ/EcaC family oxidoreductase [Pirellulales bacterium]|nr:SgcJ/EcaC family oxidoreductase [Pirellulales bacterium]
MKYALSSCGLIIAMMVVAAPAQEKKPAAPRREQAKPAKADASADEQAIRATADVFVKAFNSGDAQALGALWTADADYTDENGQVYHGRAAIEKEYTSLFKAHSDMTLKIDVQSVRVLNPTTALEDGRTAIVAQGQTISQARYTAVHVKENGKWLLSAVRDMPDAGSADATFLALDFFVGEWVAHGDTVSVKTSCKWAVGKKFLLRTFVVSGHDKDTPERSGLQVIGFDPASRQIRSWTFDSSGGHGQGLWTPVDGGWAIESQGVLADGTPTASTDLVERVNDNILGWQSVNRMAGGQQLPNTEQVVLERVEPRS